MGTSVALLSWFAILSVIATVGAVFVYLQINPGPWSLSTRIGAAFGGAAVGTFAGAVLALPYELEGPWLFISCLAAAVVFGIALQRALFHWSSGSGDPL